MIVQSMSINIALAIPMFITWIVISGMGFYLIYSNKSSLKVLIFLYSCSIIIGGFLIGGVPNAVLPIQQIFMVIRLKMPISLAIPMIIILLLLLFSVLIFGRIFCGFGCPLGALQELASRVKFKSKINVKNKKNSRTYLLFQKMQKIIRWAFFLFFGILTIFLGIPILQIINPFIGFNLFNLSFEILLMIPLISLVITFIVSFFVYRPWCRYICPFGALASVTGRFSRYKLTRTDACTNCGLCERVCPTNEALDGSKKSECYYCTRCIDICPQDAIKLRKR
ncbi:MAG: 4Fe-4S binding protein [Promethearchaeota archaeon]